MVRVFAQSPQNLPEPMLLDDSLGPFPETVVEHRRFELGRAPRSANAQCFEGDPLPAPGAVGLHQFTQRRLWILPWVHRIAQPDLPHLHPAKPVFRGRPDWPQIAELSALNRQMGQVGLPPFLRIHQEFCKFLELVLGPVMQLFRVPIVFRGQLPFHQVLHRQGRPGQKAIRPDCRQENQPAQCHSEHNYFGCYQLPHRD